MNKKAKYITVIGAFLLAVVGLFHGSGLSWLTEKVTVSNVNSMVKNIFPILFIHVSIQCIALAILSIISLKYSTTHKLVSYFIAMMVSINALFAIWLSAYPPAAVLIIIAALYFFAAYKSTNANI